MTGRILRIELRRSAAIWAVALSLPLAFTPAAVYEGMTVVVRQQRGEGLVFLVPLAMSLGAWQARRDRRSRTVELFATTARPQWQRLLHTAVVLGLGAVTGSLLVFAGLAIYAAAVGAYVPLDVFAPAVGTALYMAAAVWLGAAVGRALPWLLVPPLLIVAGFVATVWLVLVADLEGYGDARPPGMVLLNPLQVEGLRAFETLGSRAQLAQTLWAVALAAACLVLYVATRHFRLAAFVPVGIGLAVALPLLPSYADDAITLDHGALALVCTPDEPQVCARRVHPRVLGQLQTVGREALAILSAKLPQAPSTVVELAPEDPRHLPSPQQDPDVLFVDVGTDGTGRLGGGTDRDILWNLLMGAGTMFCPDGPQTAAAVDRAVAARMIAAAWLLEEAPTAAPADEWRWVAELPVTRPAYEALVALPPNEQRARVTELREAELACAPGDRLDLLTGPGRAS